MKVLSDEETSRLNKTRTKKTSPERVYNRIEPKLIVQINYGDHKQLTGDLCNQTHVPAKRNMNRKGLERLQAVLLGQQPE